MSEAPVALVTAASRGIGAAVARRLARDGYRLALLARSEGVRTVAAELDALPHTGSVTEAADLEAFVGAALDRFGRIDAVVCNTGHPPKGDLLELSDDDWYAGLDMVFLATVRLARLVTPSMRAAGGGSFVTVSSFGAREPSLRFPVSSALRAALGGFTKLYGDRYASAGIRMNAVLPGYVDSHPVASDVVDAIPAGRPGRVEEIAGTVAWLLSPDAGYVTGQSVVVDGGLTRGA